MIWLLLFTYVYLFLLAYFFSDYLIFQPPVASYQEDDFEVIKIPTADGGHIAASYLPNPDAEFTILYSHGNAEDLGYVRPVLEKLQAEGFAVLAYDYRGYGLSSKESPTEERVYADVEAAYQYLTETLNVPTDRIVPYGMSLGGGAASYLAAHHPVGGLILEATFVSTFRVMTRVRLLPIDKFPNLYHVQKISVPVLIMHSYDDEVIGFWHGRTLWETAKEPKQHLWVEQSPHGGMAWVAEDDYNAALQRFHLLLHHSQGLSPLQQQVTTPSTTLPQAVGAF